MKQMGHVHFDLHIFTPGIGHISSEDCWCEPTKTYWVPTGTGRTLHVLEHNDSDPIEDDWVNKMLYRIGRV